MKAVLFDLDGVIVSTDTYHYQAWKAIADNRDLKFDYEINHRLRGVSRAESLQIILDVNNAQVRDAEFQAMLTEKNDLYRELLNNITPDDILPGVTDLLKDLRDNGVKIGIGSSSRNTPAILKRLGLSQTFDIVVDGNDISNSKPHPEVFLLGAQGLGIAPHACVVIEDAAAGIEAAITAGMFAVGVGELPLRNAHWMVNNLEDVSYQALAQAINVE